MTATVRKGTRLRVTASSFGALTRGDVVRVDGLTRDRKFVYVNGAVAAYPLHIFEVVQTKKAKR